MAYAKIYFENPQTGQVKEAPVGFSWTVFFFGFFPPLFRSHWSGFAILFLGSIATIGLAYFVFIFIYNKMYIKYLIGEGYKAKNATADLDFLQQKIGIEIPRTA